MHRCCYCHAKFSTAAAAWAHIRARPGNGCTKPVPYWLELWIAAGSHA